MSLPLGLWSRNLELSQANPQPRIDPASGSATPIRPISPSSRTRSFTRLETLEPNADPLATALAGLNRSSEDVGEENALEDEEDDELPLELPADFDQLPPELITLADG